MQCEPITGGIAGLAGGTGGYTSLAATALQWMQVLEEELAEFLGSDWVPGDGVEMPHVPPAPPSAEFVKWLKSRKALDGLGLHVGNLDSDDTSGDSDVETVYIMGRSSTLAGTGYVCSSLGHQAVLVAGAAASCMHLTTCKMVPRFKVVSEVNSMAHHPQVHQRDPVWHVLQQARRGDTLLYASPDRLARSGAHLELLLRVCHELGVAVLVAAVGQQAPLPLIMLEAGATPVPDLLVQPLADIRRGVMRMLDVTGWAVTRQFGQISMGMAYMANYIRREFSSSPLQSQVLQRRLKGMSVLMYLRASQPPTPLGDSGVHAGTVHDVPFRTGTFSRQQAFLDKAAG